VLALEPGVDRTAGLAAWFQALYQGHAEVPVLVGGAAVELYTGGAYTTDDLDFVGEVPEPVAQRLVAAGFQHEGRYWIHEQGEVFLELPGSELDPHERAADLRVGRFTVRVVSPEDALVDRLAAWQFWGSLADGYSALLLENRIGPQLDRQRLRRSATARRVMPSLRRLATYRRCLAGSPEPTFEEFVQWLRETS
jgi:hypothetical protein